MALQPASRVLIPTGPSAAAHSRLVRQQIASVSTREVRAGGASLVAAHPRSIAQAHFTSATGIYGGLPKVISKGLGWTFLGFGIRSTNDRLYQFLQALKEDEKRLPQGEQCFMLNCAEGAAELTALVVSFNNLAEPNQ